MIYLLNILTDFGQKLKKKLRKFKKKINLKKNLVKQNFNNQIRLYKCVKTSDI